MYIGVETATLPIVDIAIREDILARPRSVLKTYALLKAKVRKPITVARLPGSSPGQADRWLLLDGYHRLIVASLSGEKAIDCKVIKITEAEDLPVLAVMINREEASNAQGLIKRLLQLHPEWSDAKIATMLRTTTRTVFQQRCIQAYAGPSPKRGPRGSRQPAAAERLHEAA
jgi:hypothetical protein